MPKIVKVTMTANQLGVAIDLLHDWERDPKHKGLIKIMAETLDHFVWLQLSGNATDDIWKEFCAQVEIPEPFPNF